MDTSVMRSFAAVVEEGSFSGAARRLHISKSLCSKHVSDLEADLGVRLLSRSTRSVTPTAVGQEYYARLVEVLARLEAAQEVARSHASEARGRLKIAAPISYTRRVLQPTLTRFMAAYPDVMLELVLEDGRSDLIAGGYDAAVRIGPLPDSGLFARRLRGSRVHVVAAPSYLQARGVPQEPADLLSHRVLHYTNMAASKSWPFSRGDEVFYQRIEPAFCTNNGDMIRAAAVEGLGVAILPEFLVGGELAEGSLVPILQPFGLPEIPIHLVYPSRKHGTAALRAFLDMISAEITAEKPPRTALRKAA